VDGVRERERAKCEPRGLLGAIAETKSRGARERERGDDGGVEKERREEESTAAAAAAAARGVAVESPQEREGEGTQEAPPDSSVFDAASGQWSWPSNLRNCTAAAETL